MNWEAIGAVGEVVGAIGVIATLVYLAIQIRQNTKAIRATSSREVLFSIGEWHKANISNPEMLKQYHKSMAQEVPDFTPEEWAEMNSYCKSLFHILEAQFIQRRFGVGTGDEAEPHLHGVRTIIDTFPVWRKFWEEESKSGHWTEGFVEAIEAMTPGSFKFAKNENRDDDT